MTMAQKRLWNKPIRTETNSTGPGSTARPFTTSYRTNECVLTIFPSLVPFFNLLPPPSAHTLHFNLFHFFPLHQAIMKYLISSPPSFSPFHPLLYPHHLHRPFFFVRR